MVPPDELEQLSRLLEGDLSAEEARRVEAEVLRRPELAQAKERMRALSALAGALPDALEDAHAAQLISGTLGARRAAPRPSRRWLAGGVALTAAAASIAWLVLWPRAQFRVELAEDQVLVNGQTTHPGQDLPASALVETGPGALAELRAPGGRLTLGPNGRLSLRTGAAPPLRLEAGVVVVEATAATSFETPRGQLTGQGRFAAAVEPSGTLTRVTEQWGHVAPGETEMKSALLKFALPALALGAGTTTGVVVWEGHATVHPTEGSPVEVAQGGRWTAPPGPAAAVVASAGTADLANFSAQLAALQADHAALRQEVAALARKTGEEAPDLSKSFTGTVIGTDGQPGSNVSIRVLADDILGEPVFSDPQGRFTVERAPEGPARIFAIKSGKSAVLEGPFKAGSDVTVRLVEPGNLRGRVVSRDGRPLKNVNVWTEPGRVPALISGHIWSKKTNDQFLFEGFPAGEVMVHAADEDQPLAAHVMARVDPGSTATVTLELEPTNCSVSGSVVDAVTRRPISGYNVLLLEPDDSPEAAYSPKVPFFSFAGRTPGERILLFNAKGYRAARTRVTLEPTQEKDVGLVALEPLAR